jgi:hypothetical protein
MTPTETLRERLDDYAFKATMLASLERDQGLRNALLKFGQGFRDASKALSALPPQGDSPQQEGN